MVRSLYDVAKVIRSKNAGPFILTIDVFLPNRECFTHIVERLSREEIARLYRIPASMVLDIIPIPELNAIKINIARRIPAGNPGDSDVYGAQQHVPLGLLEVEDDYCGRGKESQ